MEGQENVFSLKTSLTEKELVDKVKGIIYGAAIGDGFGLSTEFMYKDQATILYGNGPIKFGNAEGHPFWRDGFRNGWHDNDFTDDTDQQLLILQCILDDNGTINPLNFAFRVKEWVRIGFPELDNKLPNGIGFTVGSTCSHKDMLSDPLRASYEVWHSNNRNLAANGALMRTGIVGAPYFWDERKVVENCMMAAKVTHADPRSVTSVVILSAIISRLLRGSIIGEPPTQVENSRDGRYQAELTEIIQLGSTGDSSYLDKFKNCHPIILKQLRSPLHRSLLRQIRRIAAHVTGQQLHPFFETDFNIPNHTPVDAKRFDSPVPLRENVKPMDEYGVDENMLKLCRDVVNEYSFLVEKHPLCPSPQEEKDWVKELHFHCFPDSISSLKLNERAKIGYTLKCLGAGLYLGTRKIPEDMTSAEFYENLITQLALETGDADTNCAVAGALLGCRLGKSGLPKQWVDGLRHRDFLEKISDRACKMILESMRES